jgi:large subunit ribosomal protein L25
MDEKVLTASPRMERGKNAMRRLRKRGLAPGVFYGANYDTTPIAIGIKELDKALSGRKALIKLNIDGVGEYEAIFRDIQRDPTTEKVKHVDLLGITRGQKIDSIVNIELVGDAVGVKAGGVLEAVRKQLRIECLPKDLPEKLVVDVSDLNIGEAIHIKDLNYENITILNNPNSTVVNLHPPTVSKDAAETSEAGGLEGEASEEGTAETEANEA